MPRWPEFVAVSIAAAWAWTGHGDFAHARIAERLFPETEACPIHWYRAFERIGVGVGLLRVHAAVDAGVVANHGCFMPDQRHASPECPRRRLRVGATHAYIHQHD